VSTRSVAILLNIDRRGLFYSSKFDVAAVTEM
jgi:hypothetical protein